MGFPKIIVVMRHAEKPDDPSDANLSRAGPERDDGVFNVVTTLEAKAKGALKVSEIAEPF